MGDVQGAELPDAARVLLETRMLNQWLGSSYSLEQVAEMDPLIMVLMNALNQGLTPPPRGRGSRGRDPVPE